jgi:hypothetical protein
MSALGGLLGGMGAAPEEGGGDPESLLQQIMALMDQYLALGPETPAFQVISDALPAIEESMGGGGMPPAAEEGPAVPGEPPVAPEGEENSPMETMMPSEPPSGFDQASAMALEDMKKRKPKAY